MALDMLEAKSDADAFVQAVYDWSPYGAAYAVAEGRHRGRPRVSIHMEMILLAVMAERRWDLILATAEKSTDALRLFGTDEAQALLDAKSPETLYEIVGGLPEGDDQFERWRSLFVRSRNTPPSTKDVELLTENSIIGWTAANVLRRFELSPNELQQVRQMTRAPSSVVRWRAVHVLGAFATNSNASTLIETLDTEKDYYWVKYGAIRSIFELAARADRNLRFSVIGNIIDRADAIMDDERISQELRNLVLIDPKRAPADWPDLMIGMIAKFRTREQSDEKRDRWENLAYKIRATYETST